MPKVRNPATGRMVDAKRLAAKRKRAKTSEKKPAKKTAKKTTDKKKPTKTIVKKHVKKTAKKIAKKSGPKPGKFYGYIGATMKQSPILKKAGITKNYATRPSARAFFDRGDYGPVCYGGACHIMRFRRNGSPFWKKI